MVLGASCGLGFGRGRPARIMHHARAACAHPPGPTSRPRGRAAARGGVVAGATHASPLRVSPAGARPWCGLAPACVVGRAWGTVARRRRRSRRRAWWGRCRGDACVAPTGLAPRRTSVVWSRPRARGGVCMGHRGPQAPEVAPPHAVGSLQGRRMRRPYGSRPPAHVRGVVSPPRALVGCAWGTVARRRRRSRRRAWWGRCRGDACVAPTGLAPRRTSVVWSRPRVRGGGPALVPPVGTGGVSGLARRCGEPGFLDPRGGAFLPCAALLGAAPAPSPEPPPVDAPARRGNDAGTLSHLVLPECIACTLAPTSTAGS